QGCRQDGHQPAARLAALGEDQEGLGVAGAMIGIDIASSGKDITAYAIRDEFGFYSLALPEGGEWTFMRYRDLFVAANHYHGLYVIEPRRHVDDFPRTREIRL